MRVVIDTNVLISAALRDRDPEAVILFIIETPGFEWVVSKPILAEYHTVLARPRLRLPEPTRDRWASLIERATTLVDVAEVHPLPRDPKDSPFLACAVASGANILLTGDRDFQEAERIGSLLILTVSQFKRSVCGRPPHDAGASQSR